MIRKFSVDRQEVLSWLWQRKSASGVTRCSISAISSYLDISRSQVARILESLEDIGCLTVVDQGSGSKATKYRVLKPKVISSLVGFKTYQKIPNPLGFGSNVKHGGTPKPTPKPKASERMQAMFASAPRTRKHVTSTNTPFRRFRRHWDNVRAWTPSDFVVYYSYLYRVRFNEEPTLDWSKDCGSASTLLKRLKKPEALKGFLQISFHKCRFKPKGIRSFTYGDFYDSVIDSEVTDDILDDWDDEWVLPWCIEERKQRSQRDYEKYWDERGKQLRSPAHQKWLREVQQKQRHNYLMRTNDEMKKDWKQFSEIGKSY